MLKILLITAFAAVTAKADLVYTLTEHPSNVPGLLPMGIAQFTSAVPIVAPTSPWPVPQGESYPVPQALFIRASSDTVCGGSYYNCAGAGDGTYWWTWPTVGVEALFLGETEFNGIEEPAEFLANFGAIDLSLPGTYTNGGIQLTITDPVDAVPEPASAVLVAGGAALMLLSLKRARATGQK